MARVEITLNDGTQREATLELPKGEPETPLSPDEMEAKFIELMAFAGHDRPHARSLLQQIDQLDGDLSSLWPRLSRESP
ncbi:hypothetical protein HOP52_00940 [Halomonas campisalis]|uniref:Uncharacterized protein n=1 Tax=Billgrantia campisalis TaxID=74661 RepID=A0ABS9P3I8_9GAMM|nr:MmgE/PrpD family protein [Halomonas campisalis]MCG6656344.1 hypothetical protein [Halomonas campisalis]MDR5861529.1 MmgE/PrpD family protein [Halomonas campisalis]